MKTQRGLSLVELMVSITIGLLLLLGLGTIFVSMKQTSTLRQGLSALQNNERMAMMFLETSIHTAGYYPSATVITTSAATEFPVDGAIAAGQALSGTGANAGADTLSVRFVAESAAGMTSSQGCSAALNPGDLYRDDFSIAGGNLTCNETDKTAGTATVPVTLITGLTAMNVLYGVDPTCTGSVTEYLTAAQVTAAVWVGVCPAPYGAQLKTVNITLTFTNPLAGQSGQPATISIAQTTLYMNGL